MKKNNKITAELIVNFFFYQTTLIGDIYRKIRFMKKNNKITVELAVKFFYQTTFIAEIVNDL